MSDSKGEPDVARLAADLSRSLRDLQRELEPRRGPRPPTPRELLRFTDEVAIPAVILLLETNVRALELLQRAIRLADGGESGGTDAAVRTRAAELSRTTLARLDAALADVQDAIEGRPADDDARALLDEARTLRAEIDDRLGADAPDGPTDETRETREVPVDVEAELRSIRDEVDGDDGGDEGAGDGRDG